MVSRKDIVRRGWRFLRGLLLSLLVVVLLLALVVILPVARGGLLKLALGQAHRFLPGELTVEHASWPGLGHLELQGLLWRVAADDSLSGAAAGDTLALVENLLLEVDLESLRSHDLLVRHLSLSAGPLDIPHIIQLFPTGIDSLEGAAEDTLAAGASFIRQGELPMVPSVAVDKFQFRIRSARLTEVLTLTDAGLEGMLEMRADHDLGVQFSQGLVRLEMLQDELLVVNADRLELSLRADVQKQKFLLDSLLVRIPEAGNLEIREAWMQEDPVILRLTGQGSWTDTGINVAFDGDGSLPGAEHVQPLVATAFPPNISGPLVGSFSLNARVPDLSAPDPSGSLRVDFSQTSWMDRFLVVAVLDQSVVTVDTLNAAILGASLVASGVVDSTSIDAQLEASLVEPTLLHLFGGPAMADARATLDLSAAVKGPWPYPAVDLDLRAGIGFSDIELPEVQATVWSRQRLAEVVLSVDQGLQAGEVTLDSIQLNWSGDFSHTDSLTHRFDLGVWAPLGRVALGGRGTIDTLRTVILDSLVVVSLDSVMRTSEPATIIHGPGPQDLQISNFRLVGGLGTIGMDCKLDESGLTLEMATDLLLQESFLMEVAPNDLWQSGGGTDLTIKAAIDLEGGPEGPVFTGQARAALQPHRDNPEVAVDVAFYLIQGDSSGLGADLMVQADQTSLLSGRLRWPGHPDLETGKWVPDSEKGIEIRFPNQDFDLGKLEQVLPPDVALAGVLSLGGEVLEEPGGSGNSISRWEKTAVNAHLDIEKLDIDLPNRSRISLGVNTKIEGTALAPVITGEINVLSGFFRIPEIPRTLLPIEGESLLWQAMAEAVGDSSVEEAIDSDVEGPLLGEAKPVYIPELDIRLEMPGNMIVNGYGLNIELMGSLQATRGEDFEGTPMVVLKGHAGVRQGTLKFMNNVFDVDKADIRFNNAAPPNPHLDVQLIADISGYLIYLKISGLADDPVIELTSEPDMNEADIIAVLLFGQPANDLDNDQRGRAHEENDPGAQLRENLAAMAVVFGGAGLQNKMSNTLGVDMVEMGADSDGESTLVVGKFLTPKVLLKYNQSLEKSGTYFMTMEYRLSRYFKLLSTYGQGEEASGLELKWSRRY